jgi:hypothetical protein
MTLFIRSDRRPTEQSERDQLIALADSLEIPFAAQSHFLKEFVLRTLVPAAKKIKDVYTDLDTKVDPTLAEGILVFNDACKKMEKDVMEEEDAFKQDCEQVQANCFSSIT